MCVGPDFMKSALEKINFGSWFLASWTRIRNSVSRILILASYRWLGEISVKFSTGTRLPYVIIFTVMIYYSGHLTSVVSDADPDPDFYLMRIGIRLYTLMQIRIRAFKRAYLTVLRIRDVYPGSWFLPIPDLGSRIPDPKTATKERGEKNLDFLCSHKI
jgi:hypothetical protein